MKNKLGGTGVALVTPFDKNLNIDWRSFEKLLMHTAEKGVDYYVVQGTTGESATTTKEEKAKILRFVKENNPHKLPVVYGLGGNNTNGLLEDIKKIDFEGIDAVLSVSPYYNKPSQAGLIKHYTLIANNSPVPVILYNVPGRTSSNITAQTTLKLAGHDKIVGVKEASGNLEQCMAIAKDKPQDFLLISGDDMLTLPILAIGGVGVISVLANAFADILTEIVQPALAGNYKSAREAAFKLCDINPLMFKESNPVGVKQVLKIQGICENYVRLPLLEATEGLQQEIKKVLTNMAS